MKRAVMLLLAFVLCFGTLTGCFPKTNPSKNTSTDETASVEAAVELKMIMISMGMNLEDEGKVVEAMNEIILPAINATIDIEWIDMGDFQSQMNLKLTSEESIDILPTFAIFMAGYFAQEALMPITDIVKTYGQGIIETVDEDYIKAGYINGELYGIPCISSAAKQCSYYYRKDLAEQYDLDFSNVNDLADLTAVFEKAHAADPELMLVISNNPTESMLKEFDWDGLGDQYGVLLNPVHSAEVTNLYASQTYKEYITIMHDWYVKGYVQSDAATTADNIQTLLSAGNALGVINRSYPGEVETESANCGYELVEVPLTQPLSTTSDVANLMITIPSTSKNPQKAVEFIELLYTNADLLNLLYYGIEGEHYQMVSDHQVSYLDDENIMTCKYVNKLQIGNVLMAYLDATLPATLNENLMSFNESAQSSKALGFSYDSSSVANQLAALDTVCAKYRRGLECGTLNPATELPKFLAELEAAGIQDVIDVKQVQLDAWLDENQ